MLVVRNLLMIVAAFILFGGQGFSKESQVFSAQLAHEAVEKAVSACKTQGFDVTATVVNSDGQLIAVMRGDGATPHTIDSSRQKAYTAASFGPIVKMDKTSEIAERLLGNQMSAQLAHVPNILLVGGGVVIKVNGKVVAGIGVGGAPGGNLDEACALAGIQ